MKQLFLLLFTSITCLLSAQESNTGAWYMYFGNQSFSNRWNWHNEVQYRNYNLGGDLEQFLFRTGIGYNLSKKNNNVLLGYAYVYSEPYIGGTDIRLVTREHRIYQQYLTRQNFGRFFLTHRYRIEERFVNDFFRMRLRYAFSLQFPINKPTMEKGTIYLALANEIFLYTKTPVFDRDRVFGAIGYSLSKNIKIEAGYMIQLLERNHRGQLQIALFNNAPFNSKAEQ